ncbi:unnamed protein product [Cyprideis torosa]|uniref:Uncharacterized protein n=1 Tax=Cyprideis torosa TaxID=163714 RepID=A0A7R8WPX4_9CRUS|nr:unnamed protein product [Cyprideis torosa]CAG0901825.1 unnamed protein product [Cyprideis torosa]
MYSFVAGFITSYEPPELGIVPFVPIGKTFSIQKRSLEDGPGTEPSTAKATESLSASQHDKSNVHQQPKELLNKKVAHHGIHLPTPFNTLVAAPQGLPAGAQQQQTRQTVLQHLVKHQQQDPTLQQQHQQAMQQKGNQRHLPAGHEQEISRKTANKR